MAVIKFLGRMIGYVLVAPFVAIFGVFFGLPTLGGILIAKAFPDDDLRDFRIAIFALILALIQNVILILVLREVYVL